MDIKDFKRIIAIGDLHGHAEPLFTLIEKIQIREDDLIIFIGDYVDRGPESKFLVDNLIELKLSNKNIIFLKGNHEDMLLGSMGFRAVVQDLNTWLYNGGTRTLISYGMEKSDIVKLLQIWSGEERSRVIMDIIPKSHLDFFLDLKLFFDTEKYFFCHAGLNPRTTIENGKKNAFDLLWMRDHIYAEDFYWEKAVVCGHTPLQEVLIKKKLICIDTGLYYYGKLSAVDVLTKQIFQVRRF